MARGTTCGAVNDPGGPSVPAIHGLGEPIKGGIEQRNSKIRWNGGISKCTPMACISRHDHKVNVHRSHS